MPNWYDEGREVTIPLDLRFSPSQNAQNFFKNYKKKQTAARMLVDLLAEGEKEIAYLETVLYEVETASGEAALNEIRAELKSQGYPYPVVSKINAQLKFIVHFPFSSVFPDG